MEKCLNTLPSHRRTLIQCLSEAVTSPTIVEFGGFRVNFHNHQGSYIFWGLASTTVYWESYLQPDRKTEVASTCSGRREFVQPTLLDGQACLGRISHMPSIISLGRAIWTSLGVGVFYNTISCPLVHMDRLKECVVWHYFPGRVYLMSTVRCATCPNFIDDQSHRFIFSRGKPRVISQLVVSFQMPRSAFYKQWNSSSTLRVSKIFFPDTPHLEPRLEVPSRLQLPSVLEPGILSFLVFRFSFIFQKK